MKTSLLRASVSLAAIAALVAGFASPAVADTGRSLNPGDALYTLECGGNFDYQQLFRIDAQTGVSTQLGTPGPDADNTCAMQPAFDSTTNTAYFLLSGSTYRLASVNLTTGLVDTGFELTIDGDFIDVTSIAINSAGVIYATSQGQLYTVNPLTGNLKPTHAIVDTTLYGLAFAPNDTLYGINYPGELYAIDVETGVSTLITTLALTPETDVSSFQFDSNGILWIINAEWPATDLWSVDLTNPLSPVALRSGVLETSDHTTISTGALLITHNRAKPVITSDATAIASTHKAFNFTVTATGNPAPAFTVTAGTLPAGVTLNPVTGLLSGTPTASGIYSFTITATNILASVNQAFTLKVIALPIVGG